MPSPQNNTQPRGTHLDWEEGGDPPVPEVSLGRLADVKLVNARVLHSCCCCCLLR